MRHEELVTALIQDESTVPGPIIHLLNESAPVAESSLDASTFRESVDSNPTELTTSSASSVLEQVLHLCRVQVADALSAFLDQRMLCAIQNNSLEDPRCQVASFGAGKHITAVNLGEVVFLFLIARNFEIVSQTMSRSSHFLATVLLPITSIAVGLCLSALRGPLGVFDSPPFAALVPGFRCGW